MRATAWSLFSYARSSAAIYTHPIKSMLWPTSSIVDTSLFTRCGLSGAIDHVTLQDVTTAVWGHSLCVSVMLQIDAKTLSYAGRALHMVHQHGIGASSALGTFCGLRDAPSVLHCYARSECPMVADES